MAITSGVRAVTGTVTIGGQTVSFQNAQIVLVTAREQSTFNVVCALRSFPGGDQFFASVDSAASVAVVGKTLISGECNTIDIDYLHSLVTLEGHDMGTAMNQTKSNESFKNQTRSQIVSTIAEKFGLTANIDTSGLGNQLAGKKLGGSDYVKLTDGISYGAILHKMAELDNARWNINGTTLNYGSGGTQAGGYSVVYQAGQPSRSNFIDLQVTINCQASKGITATVKGFDTSTKKVVESTKTVSPATSGGGNTAQGGIGGNSPGGSAGGTSPPGAGASGTGLQYSYRAEQTDQAHLDDLATNKAEEHAAQEIKATVIMAGDPAVEPTMELQLQGTAFDQSLKISSIQHDIGVKEGWLMTITANSARSGRSAQ